MLKVEQILAWDDNYIYVIQDEATGITAVVDPTEAEPVLDLLQQKRWTLSYIFNTHHHPDHIGGNRTLIEETGCKVVGAAKDAARIPGISIRLLEGDVFFLGESEAKVFEVHGHTIGHIAYWFSEAKALFSGDTIFSLGCGKLFEGTPEEMWNSIAKLRKLPGDTKIYGSHEYTLDNAKFALLAEPENQALLAFVERVKQLRAAGKPTIPSLLKDECSANPFLRPDSIDIQRKFAMEGKPLAQVFGEIRRRKDLLDSGREIF